MATRFYLPSTGTSPLNSLAQHTGWFTAGSPGVRRPCYTTKQNTALTNVVSASMTAGTTYELCSLQYVSPPLSGAQSISGTRSGVLRVLESLAGVDAFWGIILYVVSRDGTTITGTLEDDSFANYQGAEWGTAAATRITSARAITTVSAADGDRVVIEFGPSSPASHTSTGTGTMRVGEPTAAADFALTSGLTTDLCPWIELSSTLTFGSESTTTNTNQLLMMGCGT